MRHVLAYVRYDRITFWRNMILGKAGGFIVCQLPTNANSLPSFSETDSV